MNGLQRIQAAQALKIADRVAVVPVVAGHAALVADVPLDRYLDRGESTAQAQLAARERYGTDAVFAMLDPCVEAEAMGCFLHREPRHYPVMAAHKLRRREDIDHLSVPNPLRHGRMSEQIRAAERLRREVGDACAVVGRVLGPLTLALQLAGTELLKELAVTTPRLLVRLLDLTMEVAAVFGRAQVDMGCHYVLVLEPAAASGILDEGLINDLVLPRLEPLTDTFASSGSLGTWLIVSGARAKLLSRFTEAGASIAGFDDGVGPDAAREALPGLCLAGNLDPRVFVEDPPEVILDRAGELLEAFSGQGGFMLSTGGEIPLTARPESVAALQAAARAAG